MSQLKTAVLLTGAAARISQEVAIIDQLRSKKNLLLSQDDTLLAGFSSGSLNLLAINGCFGNTPPITWDVDYIKNVLFPLKSDQVYTNFPPPRKIFPLLDTSPLRLTLNNFLDKMHYKLMSDLPFNSYVLAFSDNDFTTEWAFSADNDDKNLILSDLFMGSTAIPLLFPAQSIGSNPLERKNFPYGKYSDGGTAGTFKRFEKILGALVKQPGQGAFDTMYIISPMRETGQTESVTLLAELNEICPKGLDTSGLKDFLSKISINGFLKFLRQLQDWNNANGAMANNIYVCIPTMENNFPIINFDYQQQQYFAVDKWANDNPGRLAIPLDQYLKEHETVSS